MIGLMGGSSSGTMSFIPGLPIRNFPVPNVLWGYRLPNERRDISTIWFSGKAVTRRRIEARLLSHRVDLVLMQLRSPRTRGRL